MPILNELKMKGKCVIWTWPEEGLHMSEGLLNIRLKKINKSFFFSCLSEHRFSFVWLEIIIRSNTFEFSKKLKSPE